MDQPKPSVHPGDDAPPVLGTWPQLYAAILLYLTLLIAILFVVTQAFRY